MTCSLGWSRKDEEGNRLQIEFKLVRDKITWKVRHQRFEPREELEPTEEDWEILFDQLKKNLNRGKLQKTDVDFIRRYARDQGIHVS